MDSDNLIEEYKICHEQATNLEEYIWKTGAIFGIGSSVGIVILSKENINSLNPYFSFVVVLLAIGILIMWWGFARRWWSIQQIMFYRMREIEDKIGFESSLLVEKVDKIKEGKLVEIPLSKTKRERLKELKNNHERRGIQPGEILSPDKRFSMDCIYSY